MHAAAENGHAAVVELFLNKSACINFKDRVRNKISISAVLQVYMCMYVFIYITYDQCTYSSLENRYTNAFFP